MNPIFFQLGRGHSGSPEPTTCSSLVIATFLQTWSSVMLGEDRDRLLSADKWALRVSKTRGGAAAEKRRAYLALDWLVRVYTPAWLDLVPDLAQQATALRALPEVVDSKAAKNSYPAVKGAWDGALGLMGATQVTGNFPDDAAWQKASADAQKSAAGVAGKAAALAGAKSAADTANDSLWAATYAVWTATRDTTEAARLVTVETLQQSALDLLDRMLACGGVRHDGDKHIAPPTHEDGIAEGERRERAAVVAHLRAAAHAPHPIEADTPMLSPSGSGLLLLEAARIERGEHREGEP